MHLPNTQAKVLPNEVSSVVAGIDRDQKLPTFCWDVFSVVCWSMHVRNLGEAMSDWLVAHRQKSCPCGYPGRRTDYGCFPRPHRLTAHRQKMLSLLIIRGDVLVTGTSRDQIAWPHTGRNVRDLISCHPSRWSLLVCQFV